MAFFGNELKLQTASVRDHVATYLEFGFVPLPLRPRDKRPMRDAWQTLTREQAAATAANDFAHGENVGIVLGEPSNWLVDVDLDCNETRALAVDFMPRTLAFGRGDSTTHYVYRSESAETRQFKDPTDGKMLVEIRSTGAQTMFPPSIHPSGETLEFRDGSGEPAELAAEDLERHVATVAAIALLARHWPSGGRHEAQLALAGALLETGRSDDEAERALCAVCRASANADEEPSKRAATIASTRKRLSAGEHVTGWGTLAQHVDSRVVNVVRKWLCGAAKPRIVVTTQIERVADQAVAALSERRDIYRRGDALVRVVRDADPPPALRREDRKVPLIKLLPEAALREAMSSSADWVVERVNKKTGEVSDAPALPPDWAVRTVMARCEWQGIAPIEMVTESPVLRPDGTLLTTPGYDPETGILYVPAAEFPVIPEHPTQADARRAVAMLDEVVCDIPFELEAHRAGLYAAILTPLASAAFFGRSPLFLHDSPTPGSGKGLLTKAVSLISTGRLPAITQYTGDTTELDKRITTFASEGDRVVVFDNIVGKLGGPALCQALTEPIWSGRLLGQSRNWTGPFRTTILATGNNCTLGPDMDRRVVHIRLDPQVERPELRTGFRHPDLLRYVGENRPRLTAAALTILRAYCAAGRPPQQFEPWGSYEGWAPLVIGALRFAGLPDPGSVRENLREHADDHGARMASFLEEFDGMIVSKRVEGLTVKELVGELYPYSARGLCNFKDVRDALEAALGKGTLSQAPTAEEIGKLLRDSRGRIFGKRKIVRCEKDKAKSAVWGVEAQAA